MFVQHRHIWLSLWQLPSFLSQIGSPPLIAQLNSALYDNRMNPVSSRFVLVTIIQRMVEFGGWRTV
jgi:hypothetical protein